MTEIKGPKVTRSAPTVGRIDIKGEIMTREKLVPLFEDLKVFIRSTVKGSETSVRRDLGGRIDRVEEELHHTQMALKATKDELRGDMKSMETRLDEVETNLSDKIDSVHTRVDDHDTRITTLEKKPA